MCKRMSKGEYNYLYSIATLETNKLWANKLALPRLQFATNKLFVYKSFLIYMYKENLDLDDLQGLICRKT